MLDLKRMSLSKKRIVVIVGLAFAALFGWRATLLIIREFAGTSQRYERPPVAVEADSVRCQPI